MYRDRREAIGMFIFRIIMYSVLIVAFSWLAAKAKGQQPAWTPLDPNTVPWVVDANMYDPNAALLDYIVAEPNISVISTVNAWNRGGWATDLSITLAGGSPTSYTVAKITPKPVKDPNGGFNQAFEWSWTPPGEGVYYLELHLTTTGKPTWKGDIRTVTVWSGPDVPFLWVRDVPILRLTEAQRFWQVAMKQDTPLTKPTRVWR